MQDRNAGNPAREQGTTEPLQRSYDLAHTVICASRYDQRFSYSLYVPPHYSPENSHDFRLLVAMHASNRRRDGLLQGFMELADTSNYIVLVPLFPARIADADDIDNYKYLLFRDIRFDIVLKHMVGEVAERYAIHADRFSLFGFSGGAHFVHRFAWLHPERVSAAVIAAPGSVTRISNEDCWWVGTKDTEKIFGCRVDTEALRKLRLLLLVGANDTGTNGIVHSPGSGHWMPGANGAGNNRVERLQSLAENLAAHGLVPQFEVLPEVGHDELPLVQRASQFFAEAP